MKRLAYLFVFGVVLFSYRAYGYVIPAGAHGFLKPVDHRLPFDFDIGDFWREWKEKRIRDAVKSFNSYEMPLNSSFYRVFEHGLSSKTPATPTDKDYEISVDRLQQVQWDNRSLFGFGQCQIWAYITVTKMNDGSVVGKYKGAAYTEKNMGGNYCSQTDYPSAIEALDAAGKMIDVR